MTSVSAAFDSETSEGEGWGPLGALVMLASYLLLLLFSGLVPAWVLTILTFGRHTRADDRRPRGRPAAARDRRPA